MTVLIAVCAWTWENFLGITYGNQDIEGSERYIFHRRIWFGGWGLVRYLELFDDVSDHGIRVITRGFVEGIVR